MRSLQLTASLLLLVVMAAIPSRASAVDDATFRVGFGQRDITPQDSLPMWGYGDRHNIPSDGTLDPLFAKAVVVEAGDDKVAIVGLDIGRGPTQAMMEEIRSTLKDKAGIEHVLISGSHTHHGPVIELTDMPGRGKGKYDTAVAYSNKLPKLIVEAILEADGKLQPARIGIAAKDVTLNRNRQMKRQPKTTDPMLAVVRFDDASGKPLAVLVNFAAHPVITRGEVFKFSADYPGALQNKVAQELNTNCLFMQGAAGDMSPNTDYSKGAQAFGEELAGHALELARSIKTEVPAKPSAKGRVDRFLFRSRTNFNDPLVVGMFSIAFFPELVQNFVAEFRDGVPAELNTIVLNGDTALVGGSGEFFSNHSVRLKQRSYLKHTLFFGYCNGHHMYFPTIEAASEGGYGADATVSPAEIGAGEQIMNRALINIYEMTGKFTTKAF